MKELKSYWLKKSYYASEALDIFKIDRGILHMLATLLLVGELHIVAIDVRQTLVDVLWRENLEPLKLYLLQRIEIVGVVGFTIAISLRCRTQSLLVLGQAMPKTFEKHVLHRIPEVADDIVEVELRIVLEEVIGKRHAAHDISPRLICHLRLLNELKDIDEDALVARLAEVLEVEDKERMVVTDTQVSTSDLRHRITLTRLQEIILAQLGLRNLDEATIILARHIDVQVIVPRDELALMTLIAEERAIVDPVAQMMLATDTIDLCQHLNGSQLYLTKV